MSAGVIHEDATHDVRGDTEEMRAILPILASLVNELQVRLVDQRRGLKRVIRTLLPHIPRRHATQLDIDDTYQLSFSCQVAGA
jgi:hypothetical protein